MMLRACRIRRIARRNEEPRQQPERSPCGSAHSVSMYGEYVLDTEAFSATLPLSQAKKP